VDNKSIQLFDHEFLGGLSATSSSTSAPVPASGNHIVMTGTVHGVSGTITEIKFEIEGTYNGRAWESVTSDTTLSDLGYVPKAFGDSNTNLFDYSAIRGKVTLTGSGSCEISMPVTSSSQ
jgi:hypothetical protein